MRIEEYLKKTYTITPSLNCIVFNKYGEDIFNFSNGLSNVENKTRVNAETCYGIGSVTKIFTALAILKLVESNDIKIDNYITDYLSDNKLINLLKGSNIKVSNLLSHTSGLCSLSISESRYNPEYYLKGKEINRNNISDILLNVNTNIIDKPGKTFRYLNTGYILLGLIIENVTGERYEAYIKNNILDTVGMDSTYFSNSITNNRNIATPYITYNKNKCSKGTFLNGEFQQAGGIISNLEDLKKLSITLINKEAPNIVIKNSTFDKMSFPQKILKYNTSNHKTYSGLGFFINRNFYGDRLVFHNGGIMGGRANISLIPDKGVGVVVLSNCDNVSAEEVSKMLLSNYIYKKRLQNSVELKKLLNNLAGQYSSYNNNTSVCIRMVNKKLELVFDYMPIKKTYMLFPVKYNSTHLTIRAINKYDMLSNNIFIYHFKKNYFEFNQYLFFKK